MHCAALQCRVARKASADHKQNTTVTRNNFARRSCKHTAISICLLRRQHLFRLRARQRSALAKTKGSLSFRPAHPRPKRLEHLPVLPEKKPLLLCRQLSAFSPIVRGTRSFLRTLPEPPHRKQTRFRAKGGAQIRRIPDAAQCFRNFGRREHACGRRRHTRRPLARLCAPRFWQISTAAWCTHTSFSGSFAPSFAKTFSCLLVLPCLHAYHTKKYLTDIVIFIKIFLKMSKKIFAGSKNDYEVSGNAEDPFYASEKAQSQRRGTRGGVRCFRTQHPQVSGRADRFGCSDRYLTRQERRNIPARHLQTAGKFLYERRIRRGGERIERALRTAARPRHKKRARKTAQPEKRERAESCPVGTGRRGQRDMGRRL